MPSDLENAVQGIFRVLAAEHWARFYFVVEHEGKVYLDIPEEALARTEAEVPDLVGFVRGLSGQPIDQAASTKAVGEFVFRTLEDGRYPQGTVAKAFDSRELGLVSRLFSVWLSGHEAMLDQEVVPLSRWLSLFDAWSRDEAVKRFADSLAAAGNPEDASGGAMH